MHVIEGILDYCLTFLESITFFYVVFRKSFRKIEKKNVFIIMICFAASVSEKIVGWSELENVFPIYPYLILIFVIFYFIFEVSVWEMVALAIAQWTIMSIMEMSLAVVFHRLTGENQENVIAIMLILTMGMWIYYGFVGRKLDKNFFQLPIHIWYLVDGIMLILTFMLEFFSLVFVKVLPTSKIFQTGEILLVLGTAAICILLVVLVYYFNKTETYRFQKEFVEQQNELQKEYFLQLLEKENKTRQFRHDIIDHLLELKSCCNRKAYDELDSYLTDTLGVIKKISTQNYNVGNDIVNVILNHYLVPIERHCDIEVKGFISEDLPIMQRDLCTITANLVRNAVNAASSLENGKILFEIKQGEKYISIHMENNFEGDLILNQKGIPETKQKDKRNHGIGLKNVVDIVQKYNGEYEIDVKDKNFVIEIFLGI